MRCSHLAAAVAAGLAGVICAEHPGAGIFCPDCAAAHADRHPREVDTVASIIGQRRLQVTTTTTAGWLALYAGPVLVVCLGRDGEEVEQEGAGVIEVGAGADRGRCPRFEEGVVLGEHVSP